MRDPFFSPALAVILLVGVHAEATERTSVQPYIDQLKGEMERSPSGEKDKSFIESVRKSLPEESSGSYIDEIKSGLNENETRGSFIEREKAKLEDKNPTGGAIEKFRSGHSELKMKRTGEITGAMGFRVGATLTRDVTAQNGAGNRNFSEMYGGDRVPEMTFFYEFQPFHSEWFGNVGLFGSTGFGFDSGKGAFAYTPTNVTGGPAFTSESRTRFYFLYFPTVLGVNYRFNLLRVVRPFVMAGPAVIPYWEARNDSKSGVRGFSRGMFVSAGASFLLDFLSGDSSWDLYAAHDIKHTYLTLDYSRLSTLGGDVLFDVNGISAGFTFEF